MNVLAQQPRQNADVERRIFLREHLWPLAKFLEWRNSTGMNWRIVNTCKQYHWVQMWESPRDAKIEFYVASCENSWNEDISLARCLLFAQAQGFHGIAKTWRNLFAQFGENERSPFISNTISNTINIIAKVQWQNVQVSPYATLSASFSRTR